MYTLHFNHGSYARRSDREIVRNAITQAKVDLHYGKMEIADGSSISFHLDKLPGDVDALVALAEEAADYAEYFLGMISDIQDALHEIRSDELFARDEEA